MDTGKQVMLPVLFDTCFELTYKTHYVTYFAER